MSVRQPKIVRKAPKGYTVYFTDGTFKSVATTKAFKKLVSKDEDKVDRVYKGTTDMNFILIYDAGGKSIGNWKEMNTTEASVVRDLLTAGN